MMNATSIDYQTEPVASQLLPANEKRRRAWPAILTLFWLAPITAEVLSGSTPPVAFLTETGFSPPQAAAL
jgi:hypothetical protein